MAQVAEKISTKERQKRQTVLAKKQKTVLIKFFAMGGGKQKPWVCVLNSLPFSKRNEERIQLEHAVEASMRDLDFHAYRKNEGDTGYLAIPKSQEPVRVSDLINQLRARGLHYVAGNKTTKKGKQGYIYTLTFSTEGKQILYPRGIMEVMSLRFNNCTVWANLKYNFDQNNKVTGQYRLDTVTLANGMMVAKGKIVDKPSKKLNMEGNTYRLV